MTALQARADATLCARGAALGAAFRASAAAARPRSEIVLFGTARGVLSAAVRLGIVGSYEAQRLQHAVRAVARSRRATLRGTLMSDDLAQTAPVLDLLQVAHDRLYSRLFQS